ncbi:hypothetical protein CI664_015550 [Klebsiella quasipneumoniae subsp. similipneumoniae]|nr:hypothetical protein CI664_015550 [Klebsiella quasipneumoniae subsp. similipneumoniae]
MINALSGRESCKPITVSTATRRRIYPRPGKRNAAGQDTSGAIPALCRMAASPYPAYGILP